jgi:hypothetical protein
LNKPVLDHPDFTYLGSFKLPIVANGRTTAFSNGGFAYRYVDGKLRFFTTGHIQDGGLVFEFDYPGVGKGENVPQARVVKNWGDVYSGHKWVGNDGGTSDTGPSWTYGLYYDEKLGRLYWNYGYNYNADHPFNPCFGYSALDEKTGVATGVGAWRLKDRPEKFTRGGITPIPQWFADRFTGGKALGVGFGGYYSIITTASVGPALAAIDPPQPKDNPDRSALPHVPLLGYPYDCGARAERDPDYNSGYDNGKWQPKDGVGYWTWSDHIFGAGAWIDAPAKQGVLFLAKVGRGKVWYETSTLHAERGAFAWFVYDPKDLAAVASGAKKQWEIQPKHRWTDDSLVPGVDLKGWEGEGITQVGGAAFDPKTNRLFVLVTSVWQDGVELYPQMYVYQVK